MPSAYLWCPAYPLTDLQQLTTARRQARRFAESIDCQLIESPSLAVLGTVGQWLPGEHRHHELAAALSHEVAIAARGGYGCIELVPALLTHGGRWPLVVGFSDCTILHACARRSGAAEGCYGFMPGVTSGEGSFASAAAIVRGEGMALSDETITTVLPLHSGSSEGALFPACLRVLASLVGTPAMPSLAHTILALEDIDERPYRIDRDLQQLHAAGALSGVRGLVFGTMPCDLPSGYAGPMAVDICTRWAQRLQVPAIMGLPFGHVADPLALPCGRPSHLTVEEHVWRLHIAPRCPPQPGFPS